MKTDRGERPAATTNRQPPGRAEEVEENAPAAGPQAGELGRHDRMAEATDEETGVKHVAGHTSV